MDDRPYIINGSRATRNEYIKHNTDSFLIRVPKGQKAIYAAHAELKGESLTAFAVRAMAEAMCKDLAEEEEENLSRIAIKAMAEAFEAIMMKKFVNMHE